MANGSNGGSEFTLQQGDNESSQWALTERCPKSERDKRHTKNKERCCAVLHECTLLVLTAHLDVSYVLHGGQGRKHRLRDGTRFQGRHMQSVGVRLAPLALLRGCPVCPARTYTIQNKAGSTNVWHVRRVPYRHKLVVTCAKVLCMLLALSLPFRRSGTHFSTACPWYMAEG